MRLSCSYCVFVIMYCIFTPLVAKELLPYEKHTLSFIHENDVFTPEGADRYYTGGTGLFYSSPEYDFSKTQTKLSFLRFLDPLLLFGQSNEQVISRFQLGVGQKLYTPSTPSKDFLRDDRPFAGVLVGFFDVQHRRENSLENLAIWLGVVGENAMGRKAQNWLHDLINVWHWSWVKQIPNDVYFMLSYSYMHKILLFDTPYISADVLPFGGIDAGNYHANMQLGSYVRLGYGLSQSFVPSRLNYGVMSANHGYGSFLYVFGSVRGALIGYNYLITGKEAHFNDLSIKHSNYAFEWGIATRYKNFTLITSWVYQGKEFVQQKKNNTYGSIGISVAF